MLKVAVFDSGYGGEFFADRLSEEVPIINITRIIDWRNAETYLMKPRKARKLAKIALRPYIGEVDLIIFANHLLSITSLKYFKRKYKEQHFLGLKLENPRNFQKHDTIILATKAITKTVKYYNFLIQINGRTKTLVMDSWPEKIDEGELTFEEIKYEFQKFIQKEKINPKEVILACSQFTDIKSEIKQILGKNIRIHDNFDGAIRETCKILHIRGGTGKKL